MLRSLFSTALMLAISTPVVAATPDAQSANPQSTTQPAPDRPNLDDAGRAVKALATGVIANLEQTHITACLLLGNQEEVIAGQLASNKASSDDVKAFAQMMVKQHGQMVAKLEPMLPEQVAARLQLKSSSGEPVAGMAQVQSSRRRTVLRPTDEAREGIPRPLLDMQARVAQNRIALTSSELSKHEGKDFDRHYIGCQIGSHMNMLAELMAFEPYATGDLKTTIKDAEDVTKQHLAEAKKIMEKLW